VEEVSVSGPTRMDEFIKWCKTDWLMKLGAFLLLLALGWFVTYAFVNNWIGPIGRIAMGILVGAGVVVAGNFVIPKKPAPGQILVVLGGIMILLTVFAARTAYDFFTPISALAMMSVVVVGMAIIAVVHNTKSVAILALFGGAAIPLLVKAPQPDFFVLLSYVLVLNLGTILVSALRGWREMILLALIITGCYSVFGFPGLENSEGSGVVWIFMALYFGFFFTSNILAIIKTRVAKKEDLLISGINGLLLLYWINEFVPRESASIVLTGVVVLLASITYILTQLGGLKSILYIHAALSILFLGAATAFELDGKALVIAFSNEALLMVVLSAFVIKDPRLTRAISVVQFIPIVMSFPSIKEWFIGGPLFNEDFFVLLIAILSLGGTVAVLKYKSSKDQDHLFLPIVYGIIAGLFAIVLVWLSSHNIFHYSVNVARGAALVLYSLVGVILLFYGTYFKKNSQRLIGGILLGGVVIRLLGFEVWSMSLSGKIVTFVAIGILLVSTAFFQKRISNQQSK
jgi:hypothetical protein